MSMLRKLICSTTLLLALPLFSFAQQLTPEIVVNRHLESIASEEARNGLKSRVMQGNLIGIVRIGGSGQSTGRAVMASQGDMSLTGLIFGPDDYLNEKWAFNGKTLTVGE